MSKSDRVLLVMKHFFTAVFCICFIAILVTYPVQGTVSYITSLSVTSVNTFSKAGQTEESGTNQETESASEKDTKTTKESEKKTETKLKETEMRSESTAQTEETPPTGDSSHIEIYVFIMLICAVGFVVTKRMGRSGNIKK